jgi:hypothetical protein
MRPNAHLYIRPDAYRFMPPGAPRWYGKDAVRYFWPEPEEERHTEQKRGADASRAAADFDAAEAESARFRHEVAKLRLDWELLKLRCGVKARKYSPNQPRVPAGNADGGQWTSGAKPSPATTLAARRRSPAVEAQCWLQYRQDRFVCSTVRSPACYGQAALRYADCLEGLPIPPLNF